ncbi:uncharacterized protein VDAG_07390 [Verticillium dahliae VdLs.17]|uniref:Uncharacterized protein n=1 Tax=Verticillium dahliae (strain VdLs.17 / ATCC MYA-4575 / FGSC 10137) TaxID=498257 RepID=G2XAQ9_VERDV|nr:uncharacterized protein VDAG_07390 [Verticillium dahliae VdLs.17]EGY16226.1 hypothetical protein VDAG_07390 [Verticillium dahliae VdLs.17]KAH6702693.1 hypothetical protein EV126DRAFT_338565 [Verticillium dahliae]
MPASRSPLESRRHHAKLRYTKFLKRRRTIIRKADQLHKDCQVRVYVYMELNGKSWVYDTMLGDASFPPSKIDQVRLYPIPQVFTPKDLPSTKQSEPCASAEDYQED